MSIISTLKKKKIIVNLRKNINHLNAHYWTDWYKYSHFILFKPHPLNVPPATVPQYSTQKQNSIIFPLRSHDISNLSQNHLPWNSSSQYAAWHSESTPIVIHDFDPPSLPSTYPQIQSFSTRTTRSNLPLDFGGKLNSANNIRTEAFHLLPRGGGAWRLGRRQIKEWCMMGCK